MRIPAALNCSSAERTSGQALSSRYAPMSRVRRAEFSSRPSERAANTSASCETFQKSEYWRATVRSQVYSNWRVRQVSMSFAPFPGKICSARAATGRASMIGKPSNTTAMGIRLCAGPA